jgi:hypothetical protein
VVIDVSKPNPPRAQKRPRFPPPPKMADYVTMVANFEATGAALAASEPNVRPIHRPDFAPDAAIEVVMPIPPTR